MRLLIGAALVFVAACAPSQPRRPLTDGPDAEAVQAILADISAAVAADDPARAARHYWDAALIVKPCRYAGASPSIEDYYRTIADAPNGAIEFDGLTAYGVSHSGDLGYVLTHYTETIADGTRGGMSQLVFVRDDDGAWIIQVETRVPEFQEACSDE